MEGPAAHPAASEASLDVREVELVVRRSGLQGGALGGGTSGGLGKGRGQMEGVGGEAGEVKGYPT